MLRRDVGTPCFATVPGDAIQRPVHATVRGEGRRAVRSRRRAGRRSPLSWYGTIAGPTRDDMTDTGRGSDFKAVVSASRRAH
eukprot:4931249-Prymnesium_polylepis.1